MGDRTTPLEVECPRGEGEADMKRASSIFTSRIASRSSCMSLVKLAGLDGKAARSFLEGGGVKTGLSQNEAIANFLIACVGAGIVVFPKVMADNGYAQSFIILLFSACVCYECGQLIIECCDLAEIASGLQPGDVSTYEEVAGAAFGKVGQTALAVTKNFYMLGALMAFTVFTVQGFAFWLPLPEPVVRWAIVAPIFIALGMIRDLKQLAPLAPVGTFAVFVQCMAISIGSTAEWFQEDQYYVATNLSMTGVGVSISVFVFGFDAIVSLPSMRPQMANVNELPGALSKGFGLVVATCVLVMMTGYLGFGSENSLPKLGTISKGCKDNIIDSLKCANMGFVKILGEVSAGGILVNLLISCPLNFFTFTSFVESTGNDAIRTTGSIPNMLFRALVMIALITVGSVLPFAKQLINLVSALFGSCNSIFFPLAYFYTLRGMALKSERCDYVSPLSARRKLFHVVVVATGIVSCVFGCIGGVADLVSKLKELREGNSSGGELVC